jgi:hypothetical protein
MKHELKTDPKVFEQVWNGYKDWEIRFNDRHFKKGDLLLLRETKYTGEEMKQGKPLEYTGRRLQATVVYILRGPIYGLQKGWVIMSIFPGNGWQD